MKHQHLVWVLVAFAFPVQAEICRSIDASGEDIGAPRLLATGFRGVAFTYGYNGFGDLKQIRHGATVDWQAITADALGHVTQESLGNGLITTRGFDANTARLNTIQTGPRGSASVQNDAYTYDALGNLATRNQH